MRTNATFTNGLKNAILSGTPRKVDCRIKVSDDRLRFGEYANALNADAYLAMSGDSGYETHDAAACGTGILRVAAKIINTEWRLVYQWIPNLRVEWPEWVDSGLVMRANTKPGVYDNRIFFCGTDNKAHAADLNTTTGQLTDIVIGWTGGLGSTIPACKLAFAPVTKQNCYVHFTYPGSDTSLARLYYLEVNGTGAYQSTHDWAGAIHCDEEEWGSFDAVRLNGFDYLYMSINTGRRAMCITATVRGAGWGDPQDIFPLDYSDDIAKMIIGGVTVIDSKIFVCGTLTRSSNDRPMQIYTMGPEHHTAGRDMFIGPFATTMFTQSIDGLDNYFRQGQGVVLSVGGYAYFVVPGATRCAGLPTWMGGTPQSWTYTCNNLAATYSADGSSSLTVDVPANLDPAIKPGMTLIVEPYLWSMGQGGWFQLGEFEIDAITTPRSEGGKTKSIVARPKGIKRLAQWKADASYDYWSQDARVASAGDQSVNVRVTNFSSTSNNGVLPAEHGKPAVLYSTCRPGMSYAARVKVNIQSGRIIYTGPMVSVYTETKAQAAARLGIELEAVEGAMVRTSGLLMMYTNSGTPGWYLYLIDTSDAWTSSGIGTCPYKKLAGPVASTLAAGEYEFMIVYTQGRIDTYYKAVASTGWTRALPVTVFNLAVSGDYPPPFNRSDGRGRAGFFARSEISAGELTARTVIEEVAEDAIELTNPGILSTAARIYLETPYNGVSELVPRNGTVSQSYNGTTTKYMWGTWNALDYAIWPIPNQIYNASAPWSNPDKTALGALDVNQWLWVTVHPNTYEDLRKDVLSGKILEMAYNYYPGMQNLYNQKLEIVYVDTQPPAVWIPNHSARSNIAWSGTWGYCELIDNTGFAHVGDTNYGSWATGAYVIPEQGSTGRNAVGYCYSRRIIRLWLRSKIYADGAFQIPGYGAITYHHPWENPRSRMWIHHGIRLQHYDILKMGVTGDGVDHPLVGRYVYGTGGGTPEATQFIAASGEPDRSFVWMAEEICHKAGVRNVTTSKDVTTFSHSPGGWNLAADRAATMRTRPGSAIIRFKKQLAEVGIFASDTGGANGNVVTVGTFDMQMYSVANGEMTLKETMNIADNWGSDLDSWITISYKDNRCSVWSNDTLLGVFPVMKGAAEFAIVSPEVLGNVPVDWPVLDMRVDNFVMDIGQGGIDLLRRLVGKKRVRFGDDSTGGIKIFRDGAVIGSENSPLLMSQVSNATESDLNRITRLRMEGLEVYETADEETLVEYGNVFAMENFNELELLSQFAEEGELYLADAERSGRPRTYMAPADPRIEPWDIVWVNDGSTAKQILVRQARLNLSISEDAAQFVMTLDGEEI